MTHFAFLLIPVWIFVMSLAIRALGEFRDDNWATWWADSLFIALFLPLALIGILGILLLGVISFIDI